MTKFVVYVREVYVQPITIQALSKEDAVRRVADGGGFICEDRLEYIHTLPSDTWTVESRPEHESDPFYVPPVNAPPEPGWDFAKRGKDAVCPRCGANGLAHVTIFPSSSSPVGRKCRCGAEWPIYVEHVEDNK